MPELESGLSISMILSLSLIRYIIILIISTSNSHRKSFSCSAGKERPNFGYLPFVIIISSQIQNSCQVSAEAFLIIAVPGSTSNLIAVLILVLHIYCYNRMIFLFSKRGSQSTGILLPSMSMAPLQLQDINM